MTPLTGAGTVQHPEPGGIGLAMLRAPGPGTPDHPVLCRQDPQGGAAVQHGSEVLQVQLRPVRDGRGETATTDCCSLGNQMTDLTLEAWSPQALTPGKWPSERLPSGTFLSASSENHCGKGSVGWLGEGKLLRTWDFCGGDRGGGVEEKGW